MCILCALLWSGVVMGCKWYGGVEKWCWVVVLIAEEPTMENCNKVSTDGGVCSCVVVITFAKSLQRVIAHTHTSHITITSLQQQQKVVTASFGFSAAAYMLVMSPLLYHCNEPWHTLHHILTSNNNKGCQGVLRLLRRSLHAGYVDRLQDVRRLCHGLCSQ